MFLVSPLFILSSFKFDSLFDFVLENERHCCVLIDTVAFWSRSTPTLMATLLAPGLFSFFFSLSLLYWWIHWIWWICWTLMTTFFFNSLKDYKSINWVKVKYGNSWNNWGLISRLRYKPDISLLKTFSEHCVPLYFVSDWKLLQLCQYAIYW